MRMEEDRSHTTERILKFTLEIIYLLTGERFPLVKSGDHMTITVPPCDSLKPERHNMEKILEVTKKMMELLTGEEYLEGHKDLYKDVIMENQPPLTSPDGSSNGNPPERCPRPLYSRDSTHEDHTIPHHHQSGNLRDPKFEVKEEIKEDDEDGVMKQLSEGHKDFYKDIKMEPSSNRSPPERCPRPLYSRDSTQDGHTIPHHHQSGNLRDDNIVVKEEFTERDDEYGVMKEFLEGHIKVTMKPPNTRNPPERCPRPLYSENSTQEEHDYVKPDQMPTGNLGDYNIDVKEEYEQFRMINEFSESHKDLTIPHHHQGEDLMNIKVEGEVEETYVRGDQQYTEEAGMTRTFIEEDIPTEISTGHAMEKPSKDLLTLSLGWKTEDEDITGDCGGEKTMISTMVDLVHHPWSTMNGGLHSVDRPWNPSDSEEPRTVRDGAGIQGEGKFICAEREKSFSSELSQHRNHAGEKLYSCSECGKCVQRKSEFIIHQRSHTGERPYSCSECGQCYPRKSALVRHLKTHTGEMLYSCSECGKSFAEKSRLDDHLRTHLEGMLYSCSECGKCYPEIAKLVEHQKSHTGERPYSCPECGKCYLWKADLVKHQKSHTGERPYSCPECGQCFPVKSTLVRHLKTHTGEKPYSCPECGKCFLEKSYLYRHFRNHTGEKPHSCSECGKYCRWKSELILHQRSHTGEKPYSCSECGKCFSLKSLLHRHLRRHTSKKT